MLEKVQVLSSLWRAHISCASGQNEITPRPQTRAAPQHSQLRSRAPPRCARAGCILPTAPNWRIQPKLSQTDAALGDHGTHNAASTPFCVRRSHLIKELRAVQCSVASTTCASNLECVENLRLTYLGDLQPCHYCHESGLNLRKRDNRCISFRIKKQT